MNRKFTKLDEGFLCAVCGKSVPPLSYTSRDHCPHCLHSMHLDENPGDRRSECGGILRPIGLQKAKKGYQILYQCEKCGQVRKNIVAADDDGDLVIELSSRIVQL